MSRILISGATGFLGSHLVARLLREGHELTLLIRSSSDLWRIESVLGEVDTVSVEDDSIRNIIERNKIDTVVHTACDYGRQGNSPYEISQTNVGFGLQLLSAAIEGGVARFINTDTFLPRNMNPYAITKYQFLDWLKHFSNQVRIINFRLEHMYGPKDDDKKFLCWFIQQLKNKQPRISLTSGEQLRDFIHVRDVVDAFALIVNAPSRDLDYEEFDIGTGYLTSVRDLTENLYKLYVQRWPDTTCELGFGDLPSRPIEFNAPIIEAKAIRDLGWSPRVSLADGLKELVKGLR